MRVLIAGGTGFVGRALITSLQAAGHEVALLSRSAKSETSADLHWKWDPKEGQINERCMEGVDAVVNLCGENLASGRWTSKRKLLFRSSRLDSIRLLAGAAKSVQPGSLVWLNASATGFYGDRGSEWCDESSRAGKGFLAELCSEWEAEVAALAPQLKHWTVLRIGMVLDNGGGALAKLVPLFRWGLGSRLGDGAQWISWIHRQDLVAIITDWLQRPQNGPINAVSPEPVTNDEFTKILAKSLHRRPFLPAPAWAIRLGLGEMSQVVLTSQRVRPARLEERSFVFQFPHLTEACEEIVDRLV